MSTSSSKIHQPSKASPQAETGGSRTPLLLLVEDHEDTREMYRFLLASRGYRIIEARDGEEAVHLAHDSLPDLILMDSILPRVDGVTAAGRIRQNAALHNVPIIFVSGQAEVPRKHEALAAGGDEYLIKPVSLSDLEATVERQLAKSFDPDKRRFSGRHDGALNW